MDIFNVKPFFTKEEVINQIVKAEAMRRLVRYHMLELGDINKITDEELWRKNIRDLLEICAHEAEPEISRQIKAHERIHKHIPQWKD